MAKRGSGPGRDQKDKWVTGEAPTLEESSQTGDNDSVWDAIGKYLPYWITWNETYYGMLGGFLLLAGLLLVASTLVTCWDSNRLDGSVAAVRDAPSVDTYGRWQEALDEAADVRANRPGGLRSFFHTLGFLAPGTAPEYLRDRLVRLQAYTAANVEYRFEHDGSRRASGLLEDDLVWKGATTEASEGEPPLAAAGATLRALARGEYDSALSTIEQGRESDANNPRLIRAHLEAALAAGRAGSVETLADTLNERPSKTVYDRYLLMRSAPYHPELSASTLSESLSSEESGDHLGVRIEEVATLRRQGDVREAREVGSTLLEDFEKRFGEEGQSGPTFQLARLQNEIGRACKRAEDDECAERQFEAAIRRAPRRGSVYVPRIETQLDRTKLAEAEDLLDRAETRAGRHTDLAIARARLQFLRSRWGKAAATLDRISESREFAPVLRARILLEMGEYLEASKVLDAVPSNSPEADRVRALQLLASERASPEATEEEDSMAEITEESEDAVVLRAGAQFHLARARSGEGGDSLERARELLDRASEGANAAIATFLRCELHRLAGEWEEAGEACAEARREHEAYLPGMLTAVRIRLQTQRPERAALLAERLAGQFDDWDVAKLRMRALVRSHQLELAEEVLSDWSDREVADRPEFALFEGHLAFARADYASAVDHYETARKSHAYGEEADIYYAHTLVRLGRLEEAETLLKELNDREEWKGVAWVIFGELRRRQDKDRDALQNLRIASRHLDMDHAPRWRVSQLYGQLALTWQQRRDWSHSRVAANLEKARDRGDPRSPEFAYPYGLSLLVGPDSDSERAVRHLSGVVDLQPYNCGAVKALKTAYEETRDWAGRNDMRELEKKHCPED